jgi:uncharacterized protein YciI
VRRLILTGPMYVIVLHYRAPLEKIDALKDAHYANPQGLFARGMVRFAGPLRPRTGGMIIADGERSAIEAAVASDPFITSGAATAEILEFQPTWPPDKPTGATTDRLSCSRRKEGTVGANERPSQHTPHRH